jgi:beta-phosphoglucomutase-like phosphatase (HAD superfamily)
MIPYGIDMTDELFSRLAGMTSPAIVAFLSRETGQDLPAESISLAKDQAFVRHAPLIQPIRSVLDIAEAYQGVLPMGLATNEHFGVSNILLRTTGLSSLFQTLVTVDEVENPKPAPDLFLECARRLGVEPGKCHVFEDSRYGIEAARAAGMSVTDVATLR